MIEYLARLSLTVTILGWVGSATLTADAIYTTFKRWPHLDGRPFFLYGGFACLYLVLAIAMYVYGFTAFAGFCTSKVMLALTEDGRNYQLARRRKNVH